jgi:hypothetical protein
MPLYTVVIPRIGMRSFETQLDFLRYVVKCCVLCCVVVERREGREIAKVPLIFFLPEAITRIHFVNPRSRPLVITILFA